MMKGEEGRYEKSNNCMDIYREERYHVKDESVGEIHFED